MRFNRNYKNTELEIHNHVATIWLNRPEVHNALNEDTLKELTSFFKLVSKNESVHFVILRGRGKVFCSGADIKWMKQSGSLPYKQNKKESALLAKCFYAFYKIPQPTAVIVTGAVIGGGLGLMSAADFVISTDNTTFSLSEARIGLVPAVIMPFLLKRANEHKLSFFTSTAKKINADEALKCNLVDFVCTVDHLNNTIDQISEDILKASPSALIENKKLIHFLNPLTNKKGINKTIESISKMKMSDDGQEGMKAFFEKRQPKWVNLQLK